MEVEQFVRSLAAFSPLSVSTVRTPCGGRRHESENDPNDVWLSVPHREPFENIQVSRDNQYARWCQTQGPLAGSESALSPCGATT